MFTDRPSAGRDPAERIASRLAGQRARVYGLARGGVIVGRPGADRLGAALAVLVACKVGAPGQPELALGAVAEGGGEAWDADLLREFALDRARCVEAARGRAAEVERRTRLYRDRVRAPAPEELALVVDDGIATGSTVLAAVRGLSALGAARIAVAAPLAAKEALERLRSGVEWIEALIVPERFGAVGAHYQSFDVATDRELVGALAGGPKSKGLARRA